MFTSYSVHRDGCIGASKRVPTLRIHTTSSPHASAAEVLQSQRDALAASTKNLDSQELSGNGSARALLSPVVSCPWTLLWSGEGASHLDGSKPVTCGLPELSKRTAPCVTYSFGASARPKFTRQ